MARGGKRAGAGRKLSYASYEKQYNANKAELAQEGLEMYQRKLSKSELETQFLRMKNEREKEIAEGKRKTLGNIMRDLVEKQTYELSFKQAKALLRASDKTGHGDEFGDNYYERISRIRQGQWLGVAQYDKRRELEDLRDLEEDESKRMTDEEINREIYKYISTEFFGS